MKKRLSLLITLLLFVIMLVGCGQTKQSVATDGSTSMSKVIGALSETFQKDTGIEVT